MNHRNALTGIALIIVFSASQAVSAKTAGSYPSTGSTIQNPQAGGSQDRDNLNLSAEQKAQLKSIHQSERDQLLALRNDQTLTEDQKRAKAQTIRQASRQQLLGILTPQQQQALNNNRKNNRLERGERGEGRRGPEGNDSLNLTADQKTQLKSIHESTKSQVDAVRNDSNLTAEQKEAKLRSIHQNTLQQVSGILTPEQREKMRANGPGRRGGGRGHDGPRDGQGRGRQGGLFGPPSSKP
jgi:Spy/CpxP family protein refolding chaperone